MADLHIYLGVTLAGLVSFLSPCVLPLVPPYLGYLGGTTVSQAASGEPLDDAAWRRIVLGSVLFVLGFTTVFVALGAGASVLGQFVQSYKSELSVVAGVVIVLFGLHFLGVLRIPLLYRDTRYRVGTESASLVGAFVMGLAFAFGWTPCVGPILSPVLMLAASEGTLRTGATLLMFYSLGLGIPFVLAAVAIRPFLKSLQRIRPYLGRVEKAMGALLILTGLLFMLGWLNLVGAWLLDTFPVLGNIEEWLGPKSLQSEILKKGHAP
jgi:cytochrome c-type biogenesis protein